jgi:glycosyltransferase involved in cell wall biosynthesis
MAVYNGERHLRATCESVLGQTYKAIEVIIVDDGSTDSTGEILEAFQARDARVRLIRQENRGVAAARNAAIAAASGEFIAPIDADDLWHPKKIERQVRRFQECPPDTGMVYCWWAWIDAEGRVLDRSPRWRMEGSVHRDLAQVNFTGPTSLPLYRRSSVEAAGGYDATLRAAGCQGCEDWDLALRIAERHPLAVVPAVLVSYRRRPDSMSADYDAMWRSYLHVMHAYASRKPGVTARELRKSGGQFALHLAGVAFWSGRYWRACSWALRVRPVTLAIPVLPYAISAVARRLLGIGPRRTVAREESGRSELVCAADPLIPYDRIYARRRMRLPFGAEPARSAGSLAPLRPESATRGTAAEIGL